MGRGTFAFEILPDIVARERQRSFLFIRTCTKIRISCFHRLPSAIGWGIVAEIASKDKVLGSRGP